MSGIKYYRLAKGEEMPDEFCIIRDIHGEPSEYAFYVPEAENVKLRKERDRLLMNASPTANELRRVRAAWEKDRAENAKLRELLQYVADNHLCGTWLLDRMRELGIEANR